MKRVALHTLGCKLNVAESATLARQFARQGFSIVGIDDGAQVVVINTCSVTERADRECRQLVRRALRRSPGAYVVVTGCYAQLQPAAIARIDGVNLILGSKEKLDIFRYVSDWRRHKHPRVHVGRIEQADEFTQASTVGYAERTRAFLKIQDGCDYTCSFCTIPLARGQSRSMPVPDIVSQARAIVQEGYREIVLTGVNVGDYGRKIGTSLLDLVQNLVRVPELERIRISSIEPNLLTDELLDFWLSHPKLCKHFHIPLQSGSNEVLKGMRRRYPRERYADRISRIRQSEPTAGIGSDVIVGFPGETDELFEETYRFLLDQPVSYLHVFSYSERANTPAISIPGRIEPKIRTERSDRLRMLGARKRRLFHESFLYKTVDVLFETDDRDGTASGLAAEYLRVSVKSLHRLTNRIERVRLTDVRDDGCFGTILGSDCKAPVGGDEIDTRLCA